MEPRRNSVKAALGRAQGCHDVKWMGRGACCSLSLLIALPFTDTLKLTTDEDRKVWKAIKLATMDEMVWTGHVYTRLSVVEEKKRNDKSKTSKSRAGGKRVTKQAKSFRAGVFQTAPSR